MPMKTAIYEKENKTFLGYVVKDSHSWLAQTIFGYSIERCESSEAAERVLHAQGRTYLKGTWQYFDADDRDWYPCVIKDANEQRVTVVRTNALGFQTPEDYKLVILNHPNDTVLIKSS